MADGCLRSIQYNGLVRLSIRPPAPGTCFAYASTQVLTNWRRTVMHAGHETRQRRSSSANWQRSPRVVILSAEEAAQIKVIELPDGIGVGASFCHGGTTWRITGLRPSSRVFIAEPVEH